MRVFETPTGLDYEVYARPVFYRDETGTWQEIKPEVRMTQGGGQFSFESHGLPYNASFSSRQGANQVAFRYRGTALEFTVGSDAAGTIKVPELAPGHVTYLRDGGGVDYDYELTGSGLKETVTLQKRPASNRFVFPLTVQGVTLSPQADGGIDALNQDGQTVWRIAPPTAKDASDNWAPRVIQSVEGEPGDKRLVVTIDQAWLDSPSRRWPVVLDPSVLITSDAASGMDVTVTRCSTNNTSSYDAVGPLVAGWQGNSSCSSSYITGFLKFDLGDLPKGGSVLAAKLLLTSTSGTGTVNVYPVGSEWGETSPTTLFSGKGLALTINANGLQQWDVKEIVSQWLNGQRANYGFALGNSSDPVKFNSSEAADQTAVPRLLVSVQPDLSAPTVNATPVAKSYGSGAKGTGISVSVSDALPGAVDRTEIYLDGGFAGLAYGSMDSTAWNDLAGLEAGTHTVETKAFDLAGNQADDRQTFTVEGTPVPARPSALGMGNGKIQVAWQPGAADVTYRVYRGTDRDFTPSAPLATGLTDTSFVDSSTTIGTLYYYRVTAVGPSGESAPSEATAAAASAAPSLTMAFTGSGMDLSSPHPVLKRLTLPPGAMPNPWLSEWRTVTAAYDSLGALDGAAYTSSTPLNGSTPLATDSGAVNSQLLSFDILGTLNAHWTNLGLARLEPADLAGLVSGATVTWAGYGKGVNGTTPASGAKVRLWNQRTQTWDRDVSHTAATAQSLSAQADSAAPGDYVDATGHVNALAQPMYAASDSVAATLSSDYAVATVTLRSGAPTQLFGLPTGYGQVLLTWDASALTYQVQRDVSSAFNGPNLWTSSRLVSPTFTDSPVSGMQNGTTYYYRVNALSPDGSIATSNVVSVKPDANPSAWVTLPGYGTGGYACAATDPNASGNYSTLDLAKADRRDGQMVTTYCDTASTDAFVTSAPIQTFQLDLLGALRSQVGPATLTGADLSNWISSLTVEWAGSGSQGATLLAWKYSAGWQQIGATAKSPETGLHTAVTVSAPAPYLDSSGKIWIGVRSTSTIPVGTSVYPQLTVSTDQIRAIVTLKPKGGLSATVTPEGYVNVSWPNAQSFNVYRTQTPATAYVRLTRAPAWSYFVDTTPSYGQSLSYQVRPVDSGGVEGAALPDVAVKVPWRRVEDTEAAYTGTQWTTVTSTSASRGTFKSVSGTYADSTYSVSASFEGTGISYIAPKGGYGKATVTVDSYPAVTVSLYSSSSTSQQTIYSRTDLPYGQHTVTVRYAGGEYQYYDQYGMPLVQPILLGSGLAFDAFEVQQPLSPPEGGAATLRESSTVFTVATARGSVATRLYKLDHGDYVPANESARNKLSLSQSSVDQSTSGLVGAAASGQTLSVDSAGVYEGTGALKIIADGQLAAQGVTLQSALSLQGMQTFSVYLKAAAGTPQFRLGIWNETDQRFVQDPVSITLSPIWQRYTVSADVGASAKSVRPVVDTGTQAQAVTFWADDLQLEAGSAATMWTPGGSLVIAGDQAATYAAAAVDSFGRETQPGGTFTAAAGRGRYDDRHSLFTYDSGWTAQTSAASISGTSHTSSVSGASSTFTVAGGGFRLLGTRGPGLGSLDVCLNGGSSCTTVTLSDTSIRYKQTLYQTEGLTGTTTVAVKVHDVGAGVNLDALDVLPGGQPWALEATASSAGGDDLTWVGTSAAAGGYEVYAGPNPGGPYTLLTQTPVTGTLYTASNNGTTSPRYYVVVGVRSDGIRTAPSNEAVPQAAVGPTKRGLDGRYPYAALPWGPGTAYVDVVTGNVVVTATDVVVPAGRMAVGLQRTYNSNDATDRSLGRGWRLNAQQQIEERDGAVVWTDGDGSETAFTLEDGGTYRAEQQSFAVLTKSPGGWDVRRKEGITQRFTLSASDSTVAYLTSIQDRNGNQITYEVDQNGRVLSMTPSQGRSLSLSYDDAGHLTLAKVLSANGLDAWTYAFSYDAAGNLVTARDATGAVTTYAYGADGRMTGVTDAAQRTSAVTYSGKSVSYQDGVGNITTFGFQPGRTVQTDPMNHTTTWLVNDQGRLVQTTDALNGTWTFTYDADGNITEVKDALGRVTQFGSYDWGNPGLIVDALGNRTTVSYDPSLHLPIATTDALGRKQLIEYDAAGNPVKITAALGTPDEQVTRFTYDQHGQRASMTDPRVQDPAAPNGFVTAYAYDPSTGWLSAVTNPLGNTTSFTYDLIGNLTTQTDPLGRKTTYKYDNAGRRTLAIYADGAEESVRYDAAGLPVKLVDPMGAEVQYVYDAAGRVVRTVDPVGGLTVYEYDAAGRPVAKTDARGKRWTTQYDALNRPVASIDPEGNVNGTAYDAVGNAISMRLPNGYTVSAQYDALNRQVASTAPPATTQVQYDAVGNKVLVKDANGHFTRYEYDNLNRLAKVYDALNLDAVGNPLANAAYTGYVYDKAGNRTQVRDALGHVTTYSYDVMNRMLTEKNPVDSMQQYLYDAAGQKVFSINGNGVVINYAYDQRGRLSEMWADNKTYDKIRFEYDRTGRKTAVYAHGLSIYRYDQAGRLVDYVDAMGNALQYGYDANGNVSSLTTRDGTWVYAYDGANRMTAVSDPKGQKTAYTYTTNGQPLRVDYWNGVYVQNNYDTGTNRLTSRVYQQGASNSVRYTYKYDAKGNVVDDGTVYKYDAVDRLSQSGPDTGTHTIYSYDAVGNRTARTVYSGTLLQESYRYTYDGANREIGVDGTISNNGNPINTQTRNVYDNAGRLIISSSGTAVSQYDYDDFDRLIRQSSGNTVTSFGYDGDGRRLFRKVLDRSNLSKSTATYFQYAGDQVIAERDETGSLQLSVTRGRGGELLALNVAKASSYVFVTDRLGSVRQVVDGTFKAVNTYAYDDFGNVTSATEGVQNDWKFAGAVHDASAGLYHLGARYYMPADGRFITQDTYKGNPWQPWTQNLYTYVGNNPTNFIDPTGHRALDPDDKDSNKDDSQLEGQGAGDSTDAITTQGSIIAPFAGAPAEASGHGLVKSKLRTDLTTEVWLYEDGYWEIVNLAMGTKYSGLYSQQYTVTLTDEAVGTFVRNLEYGFVFDGLGKYVPGLDLLGPAGRTTIGTATGGTAQDLVKNHLGDVLDGPISAPLTAQVPTAGTSVVSVFLTNPDSSIWVMNFGWTSDNRLFLTRSWHQYH